MKEPWLVVADLGSRQGQREEHLPGRRPRPDAVRRPLAEQLSVLDLLDWDEREGVLRAERQRRIGELVLDREPLASLDEDARTRALVALVRRKGLELLNWTPELRQWQARVALLRRLDLARQGSSDWPDLSDAALLDSLEDWLAPWLGKVSRLSHFPPWTCRASSPACCPGRCPSASTNWHRARSPCRRARPSASTTAKTRPCSRYACRSSSAWPTRPASPRAARWSNCTCCPRAPPVQVTQDLASFWANTYAEVKKDLKGRYPKHYWPDDPLIAEPTARAKPRR